MIRLAFYGDDFTGASDNAAQYARHGLRTLLFFSNPTPDALKKAARHYDVIGIAGTARSLPPAQMADELLPVLENFQQLGVNFFQYKCCSTFDSSPSIGSLGEAIQLMRRIWPQSFVPVFSATPEFGRYTLFGHHYARAGSDVYRLDKHPVMSRHPVTPMHESDLAKILAEQGFEPTRLIDLRLLDEHEKNPIALSALIANDDSAVFDGYTQQQVVTGVASLWQLARSRTICAMAAQGLAHALGTHLREQNQIAAPQPTHTLAPVDRLLVLSGSCSALSAAQIDWAIAAGFQEIRITPEQLISTDEPTLKSLENQMLNALSAGKSMVIYSAKGPDDNHLADVLDKLPADVSAPAFIANRIGLLYARLAHTALARAGLTRLVVAGGDSSSFTMRQLGAVALEIKASHFKQNAHVCTLISDDPLINGKEVLLKGGQVGTDDLYGCMLAGF
jgi:3-oxoisoapionate kinase